MSGQGYHLEKQIRMEVLQERSNRDLETLDKMIDHHNIEPHKAYFELSHQYKQDVKNKPLHLPYENKTKFVGIGKQITAGYEGHHKKPSVNKTINNDMDKTFNKHKLDGFKTLIQERKDFANEQQVRKNFITKDHISEVSKKTKNLPYNSTNRAELQLTQEMTIQNENIDHYYHIKKNDLNQFADAYVHQKLTIRK